MDAKYDHERKVLEHIFTVSPTMIGVCLGLITLLRVTNNFLSTYADELLSIDTMIFMCSSVASFLSIKNMSKKWIKLAADIAFFLGMFVLVIAGAMIVFIECNNGSSCPTIPAKQ